MSSKIAGGGLLKGGPASEGASERRRAWGRVGILYISVVAA